MSLQNDIEEIELSIDEARKIVDLSKRALRLSDNPDFKSLVLEGYFRDEAARLALLSNDPMLNDEQREFVSRDLMGPGAFRRYMSTIVQRGRMAEQEIGEHSETLDELRAMDADEGVEG